MAPQRPYACPYRCVSETSIPLVPQPVWEEVEDFVGSDRSFSRKVRGLGGYKLWCDFDLSDKVTHITRVSVRRDGTFVHPGTSLDGICEVG